jgi:alkylated DNA repair dioxygenase AlkB
MSHGGLLYEPRFISAAERAEIVRWLASVQPIWEDRFTERAAAVAGGQRRLLRPVYWLGGWQFACLDYYHPPHGVRDRCVLAEPYPHALAGVVARIESLAHRSYRGADLPEGWQLNTCLVNLYGTRLEGDKRLDSARLGEHRDFEPGPVASLSLGERALFQFVKRGGRHAPSRVVKEMWLEDSSLQLFGGASWKRDSLHRVLRVEKRGGFRFEVHVPGFEARRVNFTFRYVPAEHLQPLRSLAAEARQDVARYVSELARHSRFWADQANSDD